LKGITQAALYGECQSGTSLFSNLTISPAGAALLNNIYINNIELLRKTPANALLKNCIEPITNTVLKPITLESLAKIKPVGPRVVMTLLKAMPELGKKIPTFIWAKKHEGKSLFSELCDIDARTVINSVDPIVK